MKCKNCQKELINGECLNYDQLGYCGVGCAIMDMFKKIKKLEKEIKILKG